ncbi:MAG: hypothetical protein WDM89_17760 [Rhizomicrobium sp.]
MVAPSVVLGDVIDDDRFSAFADLVADRAFDVQFAAGFEAERDIVADAERDPSLPA